MIRHRVVISAILLFVAVLVGCAGQEPAEADQPAVAQAARQVSAAGVSESEAAIVPAVPAGGAAESAAAWPEIVAQVNGEPIEREVFARQAAQFEAALISQGYSFSGDEGRIAAQHVRKQVLESMIDQYLIEQAAAKQGISVGDEVLRERTNNDITISGGEETFRKWLELNGLTRSEYEEMLHTQILAEEVIRRLTINVPATATQFHLREILVSMEAQAKQLRQELDAGGDFEALARQYSIDASSRKAGGDRGMVPLGAGMLPEEIEAAISDLPATAIAGPFASQYGYHLVQILERIDDAPLSPEMRQGLTTQTFIDWIEIQRASATIERFVAFD